MLRNFIFLFHFKTIKKTIRMTIYMFLGESKREERKGKNEEKGEEEEEDKDEMFMLMKELQLSKEFQVYMLCFFLY